MSVTSRSPLRMAGANINSGNVNTGEVAFTRGGAQVVQLSGMWSGNPDGGVLVYSGAGRLNQVILGLGLSGTNTMSLSGVPLFFWDGVIGASGGPFAASGHKLLAVFNGPGGVSGQIPLGGGPILVDLPFQSGLIARGSSGAPGFAVSIVPETNTPNPG